MSINWRYDAGTELQEAAVTAAKGINKIGDGLLAIAQSLDNLARAYAQAHPPEDK